MSNLLSDHGATASSAPATQHPSPGKRSRTERLAPRRSPVGPASDRASAGSTDVGAVPGAPVAASPTDATTDDAAADRATARIHDGVRDVLMAQLAGVQAAARILVSQTSATLQVGEQATLVERGVVAALEHGMAKAIEGATELAGPLGKVAEFAFAQVRARFERAPVAIADPQALLLHAYLNAQTAAVLRRVAAVDAGWPSVAAALRARFAAADLDAVADSVFARALDPGDLMQVQERETVVEWANVLARATHGGMHDWDPWSTGGSRNAQATDHAAPAPDRDRWRATDPTGSNVDPAAVRGLLDAETRSSQDDQTAILQIDLRPTSVSSGGVVAHGGRSLRDLTVDDYQAHGLPVRIEGVQPQVVSALRTAGTVGAARVNKIIRVWPDDGPHTSAQLPLLVILETADGYVRDAHMYPSETYPDVDQAPDAALVQRVVRFASALPATMITGS